MFVTCTKCGKLSEVIFDPSSLSYGIDPNQCPFCMDAACRTKGITSASKVHIDGFNGGHTAIPLSTGDESGSSGGVASGTVMGHVSSGSKSKKEMITGENCIRKLGSEPAKAIVKILP